MTAATTRTRGRGARLVMVVAVGAVAVQLVTVGTAGAVPPPPPNPSNSQVRAAEANANAKAGAVGRITSQLASAQAALQNLQDQVELKQEDANKALVDLQTAQDAAAAAQTQADAAKISATAAGKAVDQLRGQVDQFAEGSYEQGSALGSVSAYFGAKNPKDLLERQILLNEISGSELDVLNQMQEARVAKADADSMARAALIAAQGKQAAAAVAKRRADNAITVAVAAEQNEAAQANALQATQTSLQQQLTAAQANVAGLKAQQVQYQNWLAEKQAEEARATAAARHFGGGGGQTISLASPGSVAVVLRRALSAVGIIYAWGGGNAFGPTLGVHGLGDAFGDFAKVGFDCSGLMVYAFAGAGVSLPHFSGYQYNEGRHVPIADIQPGDMLFYSFNGAPSGIHHVTLYIGNGMMVEAYESGMPVRVTPVRYYDGLLPYATRVL